MKGLETQESMCSSDDMLEGASSSQSNNEGNNFQLETTPCTPETCSSSSRQGLILQTITDFREASLTSRQAGRKPHRRWQVLLFGQAIAIAAASVNASTYILQYRLGIVLPLFQMAITYLVLSSNLACRTDIAPCAVDIETNNMQTPRQTYTLPILNLKLRIPWWIYFCMSILDVEANYMVLLSLRYTSLTSTTLLGSLTVPSVMICSRYLLGCSFSCPHYIGVCLCLLGGTLMVWSDLGGASSTSTKFGSSHNFLGDFLAIAAALLYGLGDTVAEYAIKHIDRAEYLGMLGLFGFLISGLQCCLLERDNFIDLVSYTSPTRQEQAIVTMVWYIASLVFYYVAACYFLSKSDATLLNLSLQTTSLWACLFGVLVTGTVPPPVFFLAVVLVTTGVCIYEVIGGKASSEQVSGKDTEEMSSDDESERLTSCDQGNGHQQGYLSIEM